MIEKLNYLENELEETNKELTQVKNQKTKLINKLTKCTEFFGNMIKETENTTFKQTTKIYKENEELRKMIHEIFNLRKQHSVFKIHRKSMNPTESDDENNDPNIKKIDLAVKLLMLKFKFERNRIHLKHKKPEKNDNEKNGYNQTSIKDKVKEFGNLKPKQQFIVMGSSEVESDIKTAYFNSESSDEGN